MKKKKTKTKTKKKISETIVRISRRLWRRGGDERPAKRGCGPTHLLNRRGYMCCLGFASLAFGASRSEIRHQATPGNVQKPLGPLNFQHDDGSYDDSRFAGEAMDINDAFCLTERERESELRALGRKYGVKFIFTA